MDWLKQVVADAVHSAVNNQPNWVPHLSGYDVEVTRIDALNTTVRVGGEGRIGGPRYFCIKVSEAR